MKKFIGSFLVLIVFSLFFSGPLLSQNCPPWALWTDKDNHLYLYTPLVIDPLFPDWGAPYISTSPLAAFDVADLDPSIGTTEELRQRIYEMVADDYCEFNVEVHTTTSSPTPTVSNWQIVGTGTDSYTYVYMGNTYVLFGIAQAVDLNDSDPQDYARVFCASFSLAYPGVFSGAGSTLERWANAIAGTVSHEAGHNYGLAHEDALPVPGEDVVTNHIMATGIHGLTGEMRASIDRHFSDTSYEILGHNLGLNSNTIYNWDFTNPNSTTACSLKFKILSTSPTLTVSWYYTGSSSPWIDPGVTDAGTTEDFHGTTYNVYYVDFTTGQAWSGGPSGQVPPGVNFHIGASFVEDYDVIVKETTLYDCSAVVLPLQPRIFGYDTGFLDVATGDFGFTVFNPDPRRPLILRDLQVRQVPRMIDIETMLTGRTPLGRRAEPINVISSFNVDEDIEVKDNVEIRLANLTDKRNVDLTYNDSRTTIGVNPPLDGSGVFDQNKGELIYPRKGTALSLFPSTYVYIIAEVIDPEAYYWDPNLKKFVTGPLKSKIFYQFSGVVPDLNNNGVDDLLDIRNGIAVDNNKNGVPDDAEENLLKSNNSKISLRRQ